MVNYKNIFPIFYFFIYVCENNILFGFSGVLYDQLKVEGTRSTGPPWNLTVHFSNFPDKDLLKFDSRESIESQFMSCVKEADQFKHGGRVMSTMQKKDHNQLWQGLVNGKLSIFKI